MPKRKTLDEVKSEIESVCQGESVLISSEYVNTKTPLLFKCSCGKLFSRSYEKFINSSHKCNECKNRRLADAYKFSLDDVKKIISESGCEYISGDYTNNQSLLTIRCSCGEIFTKKFIKFRSGQNRCRKCGSRLCKGENTRLYKGGVTLVYDVLRESILPWKDSIRELYNNTCPITGENGEKCDIHHLKPFKSIYEPIAEEYGVSIEKNTRICDLQDYDTLDLIRNKVLNAHTLDVGILISKKIHYAFHAKYKGLEANESNFDNFIKSNYGKGLSEVKKCLI